MGRPQKDAAIVLSEDVRARISAPEKEALDRLISERAAAMAADGITGQDTFSAWLRAVIREKAKAAGYPVRDVLPNRAAAQKAPPRKSKAGK
jgi:hypothetical protein